MKTGINSRLCHAAFAANIGLFGGPGAEGTVRGTTFGFDLWAGEASGKQAGQVGFGVEAVQATAVATAPGDTTRRESQGLMAGPVVAIGRGPARVEGALKVGQADTTMTGSTSGEFVQGHQSGIVTGKWTIGFPAQVTDNLRISLTVSRMSRLSGGTATSWKKQTFLRAKGPGAPRGSLSLTDSPPEAQPETRFGRATPGDMLDCEFLYGIGLAYQFPSH